ncbi:MAG: hypothetical protein WCJ62_13405 [Flavobacterium sp.]
MTTIFIILAVVAVTFFLFKDKIKDAIQNKRKNKKDDEIENIYVPVGLTRSFVFSFTIEELGDGKARITINKNV